jgi:thioesterase domain-containing protein
MAENNIEQAKELERFLIKHLPLARAAQVSIDTYDGESLKVSAPLAENINDKGTAFGGSLYNLCVIAGWGMTDLKAKELGLEGDIVVAKGEINYLRPLKGRLIATAYAPDAAVLEKAQHHHVGLGKSVFHIDVDVLDENAKACVRFSGKYAILAGER